MTNNKCPDCYQAMTWYEGFTEAYWFCEPCTTQPSPKALMGLLEEWFEYKKWRREYIEPNHPTQINQRDSADLKPGKAMAFRHTWGIR